MDILAITGSTRKNSYNTALLRAVSHYSSDQSTVSLFDSIDQIPLFDPEVEDAFIPQEVQHLISRLREADAVIISSPEYAHGMTGAVKNLLDWLVASDALVLKPVMVCSVSTSGLGGVRAYYSLTQTLVAMNTHVVIDSSLLVPYANSKFDDQLKLIDPITIKSIDLSLLTLERVIKNRQ